MNENKKYYAEKITLPDWFEYPAEFQNLVKQGIVDFKPWYLVDADFALKTYQMFRARYRRELFPIAHRHGSDEVACVEKGCGDTVKIINGYTSSGHENEGEFSSFWEWFRYAINEMIELNQ
jgi:hypothetical protein